MFVLRIYGGDVFGKVDENIFIDFGFLLIYYYVLNK
jgi:hypothetical protein